jgi:ryanodine receptor 2
MYSPKPVDTTGISLSTDIVDLGERIAENVHDVWAESRIREGWSYGKQRDDVTKKHPCLVPYSELSDSEKEYDRNTAMETLKLITKLGYKIVKV